MSAPSLCQPAAWRSLRGAELACGEVCVDLAMGQSVVIAIEGLAGGGHELDIH